VAEMLLCLQRQIQRLERRIEELEGKSHEPIPLQHADGLQGRVRTS
jgi:serine O-acetyltransferase